eukprot:TRINITY_DN9118_c6_g1_i1.p1 TRINITY_DN9118_c6_g1~~TRINITY_DN9118_c6_g1_i1.p1  ORF type:complete len:322 (+),score=51.10 TRINITY_DN9118_c6_g1_i1:69-968(+)
MKVALSLMVVTLQTAAASTAYHVGCFENDEGKVFREASKGSNVNGVSCLEKCSGNRYAGVKNGQECWCSDSLEKMELTAAKECDVKETVKLSVYSRMSGDKLPSAPGTLVGCFFESSDLENRKLPYAAYRNEDTATVQECLNVCHFNGYHYAGLQDGAECWCGQSLTGSKRTHTSECNHHCTGDEAAYCGAPFMNSVYSLDMPLPVLSSTFKGCFSDNIGGPYVMPVKAYDNSDNTISECVSVCGFNGYKYAGLEYGSECHCSSSIDELTPAEGCEMPCAGDEKSVCGGFYKLSVYHVV